MIPSFIKENNNKKLVLFDMDGVVAEYVDGENTKIANEEPNIYLNKRPIHSLIHTAKKLNKMKNVSVGILSSCNYHSQMIEKIEWLKKYMPFLQEKKPLSFENFNLRYDFFRFFTKNKSTPLFLLLLSYN